MHKKKMLFTIILSVFLLVGCGKEVVVQEPVADSIVEEEKEQFTEPIYIEETKSEIEDTLTEETENVTLNQEVENETEEISHEDDIAQESQEEHANVNVHSETIKVPGLTKTHRLLFLADTHVSLCDERDPDLLEKASSRYQSFLSSDGAHADESFAELMKYVKHENPELLILGGDITDSAMEASIEYVTKQLLETGVSYIYGMGNHDFEYGYEYYSQNAFDIYLPRYSSISDTVRSFKTVEYDDLIVLQVDDYGNRINYDSLEELMRIYNLGKPIVVAMHVPIEPSMDDALWQISKDVWGPNEYGASRVLLGARSCVPDETTSKFINMIYQENSPVKVVLAGHIHFFHKDYLNNNVVQIVTGAGFNKDITRIVLTP